MNKRFRLFLKGILILAGLAVIIYILAVSIRMNSIKQPQGEFVRLQDALILTGALEEDCQRDENWLLLKSSLSQNPEEILTYGQFLSLIRLVSENPGSGVFTGEDGSATEDIVAECEKEYRKKYKEEYFFLKKDWYEIYDRLLICCGQEQIITKKDVTVLGIGTAVFREGGEKLADDRLLAEDGEYFFASDVFKQNQYQLLKVYQKGDRLLTVSEVASRGYSLHNVWIVEAKGSSLQVFFDGYEILFPYKKVETGQREQIADLNFADGTLQSINLKTEKRNGKLLSVRDGTVEIEGQGKIPYEDNMKIYKLYGTLSECGEEELRIGYDFVDFVLDKGKICAALITREDAMETIRVVIKNTDFAGAYHQKVELTSDTPFVVKYGNYDALTAKEYAAGEKLILDGTSELFTGDRIYIEPAVQTGKLKLLSINRAQGTPVYRGKLEVAKTPDGLVVVNEVLLEEYLYSVVPSEMPASYPLEALKAQAVCARTYAYRHMLHSGIASFGAHVDDSAGYQVYNNIAENAESTRAVKETAGELLYYGEELCGAYYYSTSCGFGTDIHIWKSENTEDTSYLKAKRIGTDTEVFTGENMTEKGTFEAFIAGVYPEDYESGEAWYRWKYEVKELDPEQMLAVIKSRYEVNDKLVLTKDENGDFVSEPVKKLGKVKELTIEKRNAGGVADELVIEGTENTFKIISEHNIRYVLSDGESKVVRQDGSEVACASLLPSAYLTITTGKEEDIVVGYTLNGGGYGHGVGMSQNGARDMALTGMDVEKILTFFYDSCVMKDIYEE